MGTLYLIATPIGNLEDVTVRALAVLGQLDLLLCEDTRVTVRLLERYNLSIPLESYRDEVHRQRIDRIAGMLREGKKIGFASDAGTPGISDPGAWLVRDLLALAPETQMIPIPGPSAAAAALSIAGFPADEFVFFGFPPHKKGRQTFLREILDQPRTAVVYESTHRIEKLLTAFAELDPDRDLCVCRELTKIHETVYRGKAAEVLEALAKTSTKGEFVIVIDKKRDRK
ncbi:MAG: 16S rRNA (cytidine(1402)-2'-O)-methyltransferase [Patescibacteria group bacterium]|jgi:16S rRNA (cytidine1402-2'-O)-methyltransferase